MGLNKFRLENKVILIISPEFWGDHFVSKHHYASVLSKNNKVYFLNPPTDKFEAVKISENLFAVNYKTGFGGLRFLPTVVNGFLIKKEVESLESKLGLNFNIIWNFDPSRFFNLSQLVGKIKICHIVDLNQIFQRRILARSSDICFAVSQNIKSILEKENKNSFKINHGYQIENELETSKFIFPGTNKLKAILIGNLTRPSIDWEILKLSSLKYSYVDFLFIGPLGKNNLGNVSQQTIIEELKPIPNVYFTGAVKSIEIPAILKRSDFLLVSFKEQFHEDQSNCHKIMEYFGSGKMIIATNTSEYLDLANKCLIAMTVKNKEFVQLFGSVLSEIEKWNSVEKMKKRKEFARDNSYEKQIKRIETLVNELEIS